jgi:hypothetical protein
MTRHPPEAQLVVTPFGQVRELTGRWMGESAETRDLYGWIPSHIGVAWELSQLRGITRGGRELLMALRHEVRQVAEVEERSSSPRSCSATWRG